MFFANRHVDYSTAPSYHTHRFDVIILTNDTQNLFHSFPSLFKYMQHIEIMRMKIIVVLWTILLVEHGQTLDSTLCPTGATLIRDPRWPPIPALFQIRGELVSSTDVLEITQTFSASKDSFHIVNPVLGESDLFRNDQSN